MTTPSKASARMTPAAPAPGQAPASEVAPIAAATAALARAIADDLYAASTTGDVIDMLVKGEYETWREHVERVGGIAAESTPAAVRALLAGDWLERVLGLHADFTYVDTDADPAHFVCDCGHPFGYEDGAHAEWEAHLAAAIRAAAGATR